MILNASSITCRRSGKDVLREISFLLNGGQIMAVTGVNGSGKSTLLRTLSGLGDPAEGELSLDGKIFETAARRETAHWIGTETPLKPGLTVLQNLRFWMALQGDRPGDDTIMKSLHRFEIVHLADRPVRMLSSGQKRRALLTRLFLSPRPLWLLDEPEAALDTAGREDLMSALHEHCGNRGSAIIATHQPDLWQPTFTMTLTGSSGTSFSRVPPSDTPPLRVSAGAKMGRVFAATLNRDLHLARRGLADCLQPLLLFLLMIVLFPLSLGPDVRALADVAGGLVIMAAFFAALLPLDSLFSDDHADGTLETILTTPAPLPVYCAGRIFSHWLTGGLPLVLAAPLAITMLGVPVEQAWRAALVMLPATMLFAMIGASVSALVLSAKRGAAMLALLTAPLYIPVLIFGAGAMAGRAGDMPLLLLWAMTALLLPLAPLVAAGCLSLLRD